MSDGRDWAGDFDHFDPAYAAHPFEVWDDLRASCPVARSPRFRDMVVPTRSADIEVVARDPATWSSRSPLVADFGAMADFGIVAPPISSDPPYHTSFRKLLLPFFAPQRMEALRPAVEAHCDELIDAFDGDVVDAAVGYAQHIPVRVITLLLGIPASDGDLFRSWIHQLLELGPTDIEAAAQGLVDFGAYLGAQIHERVSAGLDGEDLISFLAQAELDGRRLTPDEIFGGCLLLLVAGIDTTWSAIGASLWHLAANPDDQRRLRSEPGLHATAIEELLRAYAPVTMAREAAADTELAGCPVAAGTPLLLPFPAANRDPELFDDADQVRLDRSPNRHVTFGLGIHRCLGSHLARLEVSVAVERFLAGVDAFELADPDAVTWSTGQVRGPRTLPLRLS